MSLEFQYLRQPMIDAETVQSTGTQIDAGRTIPYAQDVNNGDVYPMTGTSITDVPTPTTVASKKQYVPITGKGTELDYSEETIKPARNTSFTRTLYSPRHSYDKRYGKKAMINVLWDKQERGCSFIYYTLQGEKDCDPCSVVLYKLGDTGNLTEPLPVEPETINFTAPDGSALLAIHQTTLETGGRKVEYTPLIPYLLEDGFGADVDLETVSTYSGNQCEICNCPTEFFAVGGSTTASAPFARYTTDGSTTWNSLNVTAFAGTQGIMELIDVGNGRLVALLGATTVEAGYSDNGAAFVLADTSGTTTPFRTGILAGTKIITGNNGGVVAFSCDKGETFENQFITTDATPIVDMAYDKWNNIVWAVSSNGSVYYFTPDATEETEVTTYANPNAAASANRIAVLGADHVIIYLSDQTVSESYEARSTTTWEISGLGFAAAEDILGIKGDFTRVVAVTDTGRFLQRDISTGGIFTDIETGGVGSTAFTSAAGAPLRAILYENDSSGNYAMSSFITVGDASLVYRIEDCVPCRITPLC